MSDIKSVSIKFKAGTYGVFRNLQNKVWYAIAEYVDNAVQSYISNKNLLLRLHGGKFQFKVEIEINWEKNFMRIHDNAAGINEENFIKAFEPANIPTDNTGLHEFGMGMKTASIWLAEVWTVRTAAVNESVERTVTFDLPKVLKEKKEVLKVTSSAKNKKEHYTEIILHGLTGNAPNAFQMNKLRGHLASIYRKFIRNGEMELWLNGELLEYKDSEILEAPLWNDLTGKNILWKKDINFQLGKHKAKGFIGLLSEMSTSQHNGLSLFRRGRVIDGSHDEKYRPPTLFGQVGSFRYKRLFGELELEGFDVSFNKGSFQDSGDVEAFIEALKIELSKDKFNLLRQADEFRLAKSKEGANKVAKSLINALEKEKSEKPLQEVVKASIKESKDKSKALEKVKLLKRAKVIDAHETSFETPDGECKLKIGLINDSSISDLYTLETEKSENSAISATCKINLHHPFFNRFEQFKKDKDYQPIILIIRSLVMAEILSPSQGTKNGGNIRTNFNFFLRNM